MKRVERIVPEGWAGKRAGRVVPGLFPELPAFVIRDAFAKRDVKCNGIRISPDAILRAGDMLCLFLPDARKEAVPLEVVMEDDDYLIVNKRQGVLVQGAVSLEARCAAHVGAPVFACHRLDVQTGGLVLLAKSERALEAAKEAFAAKAIQKTYRALVAGVPSPPTARLRAYLVKDAARAAVHILDAPAHGAVPIETHYRVIEAYDGHALVEIDLITGKTHQIRAHMAHIGYPVLGDDKYGDRAQNRLHGKRRQCLWSVRLVLWDGRTFSVDPGF